MVIYGKDEISVLCGLWAGAEDKINVLKGLM